MTREELEDLSDDELRELAQGFMSSDLISRQAAIDEI